MADRTHRTNRQAKQGFSKLRFIFEELYSWAEERRETRLTASRIFAAIDRANQVQDEASKQNIDDSEDTVV